MWRGQGLAFELAEDWQVDYASYAWQKLDPAVGSSPLAPTVVPVLVSQLDTLIWIFIHGKWSSDYLALRANRGHRAYLKFWLWLLWLRLRSFHSSARASLPLTNKSRFPSIHSPIILQSRRKDRPNLVL